ncbi:MAG: hypothetical protein OEZ06_05435 [Myxococcales bacterium]|nr:hypothetical protein [Myxococcales bacterium]
MVWQRALIALAWTAGSMLPVTASASDFWDEVRNPGLAAYRRDLAAGAVALADNRAAEALQQADAAIARFAGRAGGHVLRGRSLATLGRHQEASDAFAAALARDPQVLAGELALLAAASAAHAGRLEQACAVLEQAIGRSHEKPLQAQALLLHAQLMLARGPAFLEPALRGYRQARQRGAEGPELLLGLALATLRDGKRERALQLLSHDAALLPDLHTPQYTPQQPTEVEVQSAAERAARMALQMQARGQLERAIELWASVARAGGPWAEHAQQQVETLKREGRSARAR